MKLNYKINKKSIYIVAVSFGPDSMCLLDLLYKAKANIVVAHVNYHRRPESNSEQDQLQAFCEERNIIFELLDTAQLNPVGNFQKWAREIRYEFFANLQNKYNAECVFVAHQKDDLIETYLMQKKKGNFVKYWGIAEKTIVKHANIERPLLNYSKQELLDYCIKNNVPFAIDSSNLENHYSRNKIRHSVVEKMSENDKEKIIKEINNLNKKCSDSFVSKMSLDSFLNLSYSESVIFISNYLNSNSKHIDLSKDFIDQIKNAFKSEKSNISIRLIDEFKLVKEYDEVFLINERNKISYSYILNKTDIVNDSLFEIDLSRHCEERNITNDMFPIIIKPVSKDENYYITNFVCKVRRLFIDWKLPPHLRDSWPGIYDKNGNLVYIPRYKKEFEDNHKSKFIIKFTK